jgi:Sortase domain
MKILPYLAVATFLAGVGMLFVGYAYSGSSAAPKPVQGNYFTPTPAPSPTEAPTDAPTPTPTPPPYDGKIARFEIPKFKVDVPIEGLTVLLNNELDTPHDPLNVAWYDSTLKPNGPFLGSKPGFGKNAVFAAHVNYYGLPPGKLPFNHLKELQPGDEIDVTMDNGTVYRYATISIQNFTIYNIKMGELIDAPTKSADAEWITLVTCADNGPSVPVDANNPNGPVEYLNRDVLVAQRFQ